MADDRMTIKIYDGAAINLETLMQLMEEEEGVPVNKITAASKAINEATERRLKERRQKADE